MINPFWRCYSLYGISVYFIYWYIDRLSRKVAFAQFLPEEVEFEMLNYKGNSKLA
jgi:hypothetical protein